MSTAQRTEYGRRSWMLMPLRIGARAGRVSRARGRISAVGWLMIALLVGTVAAVIGAEVPRVSARFVNEARHRRERTRRKSQLKLLRTETEEFAASVERDLSRLPTIDERD